MDCIFDSLRPRYGLKTLTFCVSHFARRPVLLRDTKEPERIRHLTSAIGLIWAPLQSRKCLWRRARKSRTIDLWEVFATVSWSTVRSQSRQGHSTVQQKTTMQSPIRQTRPAYSQHHPRQARLAPGWRGHGAPVPEYVGDGWPWACGAGSFNLSGSQHSQCPCTRSESDTHREYSNRKGRHTSSQLFLDHQASRGTSIYT